MSDNATSVTQPDSTTLRSLDSLERAGLIEHAEIERRAPVADRYAIAVTPTMARLIQPDDPHDPIAAQFIPTLAELNTTADENADPIGDAKHEKTPGLIHRYPDRVLLKLTHTCPVYCRFCFRRDMVGPDGARSMTADDLDQAVGYIEKNPDIFEVILTGGDPLILSERRISDVTTRLAGIPHVTVLRWHSRVPVVSPERINSGLVRALRSTDAAIYLGIHTNHARELTPSAREAITRLADAGIVLLSQTVLLRGVNDDAATLAALFRELVKLRVKPYYLHHADLAPGTGHFRTTIAEGQAIMRQLRGHLSGLAQPTYVLDIPGGVAKVPIGPGYLDDSGTIIDPWGNTHSHPERS